MSTLFSTSARHAAITVLFALVLSVGLGAYVASAQSEEDALRDTIRAAILSDPRSQAMTPEEIEAMTSALTRQAQSVGMTAEDIIWRPVTDDTATQEGATATCDDFLCSLNHAFGFDGSNYTIPIWLGAISLMLIFIIASIFEYRHLHKKKMLAGGAPPPQTGIPPQQPLQ